MNKFNKYELIKKHTNNKYSSYFTNLNKIYFETLDIKCNTSMYDNLLKSTLLININLEQETAKETTKETTKETKTEKNTEQLKLSIDDIDFDIDLNYYSYIIFNDIIISPMSYKSEFDDIFNDELSLNIFKTKYGIYLSDNLFKSHLIYHINNDNNKYDNKYPNIINPIYIIHNNSYFLLHPNDYKSILNIHNKLKQDLKFQIYNKNGNCIYPTKINNTRHIKINELIIRFIATAELHFDDILILILHFKQPTNNIIFNQFILLCKFIEKSSYSRLFRNKYKNKYYDDELELNIYNNNIDTIQHYFNQVKLPFNKQQYINIISPNTKSNPERDNMYNTLWNNFTTKSKSFNINV